MVQTTNKHKIMKYKLTKLIVISLSAAMVGHIISYGQFSFRSQLATDENRLPTAGVSLDVLRPRALMDREPASNALEAAGRVAVENCLLREDLVGYMQLNKVIINPTAKELTVAYGCPGPDISCLLFTTDFTKAYFIDELKVSFDKLKAEYNAWKPIEPKSQYFIEKQKGGYSRTETIEKSIEFFLIQELKAIGVKKENIQIDKDKKGRVRLRFNLTGEKKVREVIFIKQDLSDLGSNDELNQELNGEIDGYYEKAPFAAMIDTSHIWHIAHWIKPGGFLGVNNLPDIYDIVDRDLKRALLSLHRQTAKAGLMEYDDMSSFKELFTLMQVPKRLEELSQKLEKQTGSKWYGWRMCWMRKISGKTGRARKPKSNSALSQI